MSDDKCPTCGGPLSVVSYNQGHGQECEQTEVPSPQWGGIGGTHWEPGRCSRCDGHGAVAAEQEKP